MGHSVSDTIGRDLRNLRNLRFQQYLVLNQALKVNAASQGKTVVDLLKEVARRAIS